MNAENQKISQVERSAPESSPQPLTAAQNVVLTVKILAVAAAVMALLWFVDKAVH
ncbi:MAG: hypothetical protein IT167_20280 [Bryobacterales bacterium]|nr:hypothetical protein [Bryobacterales bacterium]